MLLRRVIFGTLFVLAACGSKKDDRGGGSKAGDGKAERPAPFEVKVNKVEQLESVAANKTYAEQGLGKTAPDGHVFACVQYAVTNKSDKPETLPAPMLSDAKGVQTNVSLQAAGNYLPEDWKADTGVGKIEPNATIKRADCFEVPKAATAKMSLHFFDTGWGPKFKPWHTAVTL